MASLRDFELVRPQPQEPLSPELMNTDNQFVKGFKGGIYGITSGDYASQALNNDDDPVARERALAVAREGAQYAPRVGHIKDIKSLRDAGDFAAGAIGQGIASMTPTLVAGALSAVPAGRLARLGGMAAAAIPAYKLEHGEAALDQYQDPTLAAAPLEERQKAAFGKGAANMFLESAVPGAIGAGILRKPTQSFAAGLAKTAALEGATEAAQEYVGHKAKQYLDPSRQLDPLDIVNAGVAGALTGGAVHTGTHTPSAVIGSGIDALSNKMRDAAAPAIQQGREMFDSAKQGAEDLVQSAKDNTFMGKVADLGTAAVDRMGGITGKVSEATGDAASTLNEKAGDVIDRLTDAVKTAQSPTEFFQKAFGTTEEDQAQADLSPTPDDQLRGATPEETAANMERDEMRRNVRAQVLAEKLMSDPATPQEVRDRITGMGPDPTPEDRAFINNTVVGLAAGKKMGEAVTKVDNFIQRMKVKVEKSSEKFIDRAAAGIGKDNRQFMNSGDRLLFQKKLFQALTPEAQQNPEVRARLASMSDALQMFILKTGDADAHTMAALGDMAPLFNKGVDSIEEVASGVVKGGSEGIRKAARNAVARDALFSGLGAKLRGIQSAQNDVQISPGDSFLEMSLANPDLARPSMVAKIAEVVDRFPLYEGDKQKADAIETGLAHAFGSREQARLVLDYYSKKNKEVYAYDPSEGTDADGQRNANTLTEHDSLPRPTTQYVFKDSKKLRPFYSENVTQFDPKTGRRIRGPRESDAFMASAPDVGMSRVRYDQYVAEKGLDPKEETARLLADIQGRIDEHRKRQEKTGEDRSAQIAKLQEMHTVVSNHEDPLSNFEVLVADKVKAYEAATDEDLSAYGKLANAESAKNTRVVFQRTDGSKLVLSAESMWKHEGDKQGSGRGEGARQRMRRLFSDAVANVLAREDIARIAMPNSALKDVTLHQATGVKLQPQPSVLDVADFNLTEGSIAKSREKLNEIVDQFADLVTPENVQEYVHFAKSDEELASQEGLSDVDEAAKIMEKVDDAITKLRGEVDYGKKAMLRNRVLSGQDLNGEAREDHTRMTLKQRRLNELYSARTAMREIITNAEFERNGMQRDAMPGGEDNVKGTYLVNKATSRTQEPSTPRLVDETTGLPIQPNTRPGNENRFSDEEVYAAQHAESIDERYVRQAREIEAKRLAEFTAKGGVEGTPTKKLGKSSKMGASRNAKDSILSAKDKQKIVEDIARLRGDSVRVAFSNFAQLGDASGHYNPTSKVISVAMDALDPNGVAFHESIHDLVHTLQKSATGRKALTNMLDAVSTLKVQQQLRSLLQGHDAALRQIANDKEERLAYAFQFWMSGALQLRPKHQGFFDRLAESIQKVLGVISDEESVEKVFEALDSGSLKEPSVAAEVLSAIQPRIEQKMDQLLGPIRQFAHKLLWSVSDRLLETGIPEFQELSAKYFAAPGTTGEEKMTFLQSRAQSAGKWSARVFDLLEQYDAGTRREALQMLQDYSYYDQPAPGHNVAARELATKVRDLLQESFRYQVESGVGTMKMVDQGDGSKELEFVQIQYTPEYFPRVWDRQYINENRQAFVDLLTPHIGKEQAYKTADAIVNSHDGGLELVDNRMSIGYTPFAAHVNDRQFTFINKDNAAEFAKFQEKDLPRILSNYALRASHRAEHARFFGGAGEIIENLIQRAKERGASQEELQLARDAAAAMDGTMGADLNPKFRELVGNIIAYENIVLLPMSLFSNLADSVGIAVRSNDFRNAFKALKYGLQGIVDDIRGKSDDYRTQFAKDLGIIDSNGLLESMGGVYNGMYMGKTAQNLSDKFFKFNGMESWNRRMRAFAAETGARFIRDNISNDRYMAELGLENTPILINQFGELALSAQDFADAGYSPKQAEEYERNMHAAIFKFVDTAVLRPNAAHRPIWGSDPRFQLVFHLKQFTYSFQNIILKRVKSEAMNGNYTPAHMLMWYVPFMMASDLAKAAVTGKLGNKDAYTLIWDSVARSGVLGTHAFGEDALQDVNKGNMVGYSFAGPAFSHLTQFIQTLTGRESPEMFAERSIPLMKQIGG